MNARKIKHTKLYSTKMCPYCRMEKAWLDSKNIDHEVVYIDTNPEEAMKIVQKTGQMGVPVTEIQFENMLSLYVIGFDVVRLSQELGVL